MNNRSSIPNSGISRHISGGVDAVASTFPNSGREARNLAEKHRRDKLNASIQELSTMVPHVAESSRRLDKTAVLRFAAHGLRLRYVFGKSTKKRKSAVEVAADSSNRLQFTDTLMELLDSFFITLTCHGQIVLISPSVEHLLGHCQSDLYGQNLQHITHPEDQVLLKQQLVPNNLEALFRLVHNEDYFEEDNGATAVFHSGEQHSINDCRKSMDTDNNYQRRQLSPHYEAEQAYMDEQLREDRRCFTIRLARAGTRVDSVARSYEIVKIDGCFRRSDCTPSNGNYPIVSQLIRRARGQNMHHDAIAQAALHGISGNDIVFVAMGRIIRPPTQVIDAFQITNKLEYKTRHLIDGRIVDCDQRIGLVAGYMKDEVTNLSPFSFMHQDDVRWVIVALRQMYDCNSDYGESCYRLLSRNGNFIYLQTKGYLEIDKSTNKVHSFVCVNTLLDEEEGKRRVQELKNKFSTIINAKIPSSSMIDVPASQNPQQLEKIVLCLIENLYKPDELELNSISSNPCYESNHIRYTKTPPLALVPPEPASVKHSITKSISVVNITAAKNLLLQNQQSSCSEAGSQSLERTIDGENNKEGVIYGHNALLRKQRQQSQEERQQSTLSKLSGQNISVPSSSIINCNNKETQTKYVDDVDSNALSVTIPTSRDSSRMLHQHISVLKRLRAPQTASSVSRRRSSPSGARSSPKRRASIMNMGSSDSVSSCKEIHTVLSSSLQKLDHSLDSIGRETIMLCDQHEKLKPHVSHVINQKLGKIIVEQQKQKEILVNIKNEYGVHTNRMPQTTDVVSVRLSGITRSGVTTSAAPSASLAANSALEQNCYKIKFNAVMQRKPRISPVCCNKLHIWVYICRTLRRENNGYILKLRSREGLGASFVKTILCTIRKNLEVIQYHKVVRGVKLKNEY